MSTYTPNKHLELPAHNSNVDTWDTPVNADWTLIDTCLGGSASKNATGLSGDQTLATADYQPLAIEISGAPTAAITYVVPSGVGGFWVFSNGTTGGKTVGIKSAAGGSTVTVAAGFNVLVTCDGSASGMKLATSTSSGAAGSNTQVQYNSSGALAGSAGLTFDGTTLAATGLNIGGNTSLGTNSGSTLTLVGTAVVAPNGLNFASNLLVLTGGQVAIGTATPTVGMLLTVAGSVKLTTGGLVFSDGSTLTSASSLAPGGSSGYVQYNNGSGGFGAESVFAYNAGTHTLSLTNLAVTGSVTLTSALPVAQGGTGVTTSTGSGGGVVLATAPTISNLTLTGTPVAPTAAPGTSTTQIATTAFVAAAVTGATSTLHHQEFTASGTFTPTLSGVYEFTITGAGGGGATSGGGVGQGGAGGGGAGATTIYYTTLVASTGYAVTVGTAGTAGNSGGASTVVVGATTATGGGGAGGVVGSAGGQGGISGDGGTASSGTINSNGGDGSPGSSGDGVGIGGTGGNGGASFWGGGGKGGAVDNGGAGKAWGSGGGGAFGASIGTGGTGKGGIVTVRWVSP